MTLKHRLRTLRLSLATLRGLAAHPLTDACEIETADRSDMS